MLKQICHKKVEVITNKFLDPWDKFARVNLSYISDKVR